MIVEQEFIRKKLYEDILYWISLQLPSLRFKEIAHLLLRYIFNKNITKVQDDDPVFITSNSDIAISQIKKDFKFSNIDIDTNKFITTLENKIKYSSDFIKSHKKIQDKKIHLYNGKIIYNTKNYTDISNLAKNYPKYINYALALNIRYKYMKLWNHGLARTFENMGYSLSDATEGFASAFNHYFDNFCSAFYDLEKPFGSKGSFFNITKWDTKIVYVNPPFDEELMTKAMITIYNYLKINNDDKIFIFTLPNWNDYPELENLKKSKWTTNVTIHKKGELPFINYMDNNKIVYPCDIAEITLQYTS